VKYLGQLLPKTGFTFKSRRGGFFTANRYLLGQDAPGIVTNHRFLTQLRFILVLMIGKKCVFHNERSILQNCAKINPKNSLQEFDAGGFVTGSVFLKNIGGWGRCQPLNICSKNSGSRQNF
jgi:hypothetical protein